LLDLCRGRSPPPVPNLAISRHFSSGANRDRTGDLLLAKQALSQLSYGPFELSIYALQSGLWSSSAALGAHSKPLARLADTGLLAAPNPGDGSHPTIKRLCLRSFALIDDGKQCVRLVTGKDLGTGVRRISAASTASLALFLAFASPASTAQPIARAACTRDISAMIGGKHKCLGPGEYCATRYERQYERYGFECSTSYNPPRLRRR
jgi:hypothetical protein